MGKPGPDNWFVKLRYGSTWYAFDGTEFHAESSDPNDEWIATSLNRTLSWNPAPSPSVGNPAIWSIARLCEALPPDERKDRPWPKSHVVRVY